MKTQPSYLLLARPEESTKRSAIHCNLRIGYRDAESTCIPCLPCTLTLACALLCWSGEGCRVDGRHCWNMQEAPTPSVSGSLDFTRNYDSTSDHQMWNNELMVGNERLTIAA